MIHLTSRYVDADVSFVLDARSGTTRPTAMRPALSVPAPSQIYRWRRGDRLDTLGKQMTGKAGRWWQIMDLNPDVIDPLGIRPGDSMVVG